MFPICRGGGKEEEEEEDDFSFGRTIWYNWNDQGMTFLRSPT